MKYISLILALILLTFGSAHSTIVKSVSLAEMSKTADAIVHGIVDEQNVVWNETRSRIFTITSLRVTDALKGKLAADKTIKLRQIGGTIDGLTQHVAGNAKFSPREEVIVFLEYHAPSNLYFVMGMAQGKYTVDRVAGAPRVMRNMDGLRAIKPGAADVKAGVTALAHGPHAHAPKSPPETLEMFKAKIRQALAR